MAEIRVQPKKASLAWLWVLLLLAVVAGAVWFFYFNDNAATVPATTGPTSTLPASMSLPVRAVPAHIS